MNCNSNTMPLIDTNSNLVSSCGGSCSSRNIRIVCRNIVIPNGQNILGAKDDNNSIKRTFILPTVNESGISLEEKEYVIITINANNEEYRHVLEEKDVEVLGNSIKLTWEPTIYETAVQGNLQVQIEVLGEDFKWSTYPVNFVVSETLKGDNIAVPEYSEYYNKDEVDGKINTVETQIHEINEEIEKINDSVKYYEGIKEVGNTDNTFLFDVSYTNLDYSSAEKYFDNNSNPQAFACSAIVKENVLGRNYDWLYNNSAEFRVVTSALNGRYATTGMAILQGLDKDFVKSGKSSELYKYLPFSLTDGQNEKGLQCAILVVPYDKNATTGTQVITQRQDEIIKLNALMFIRYILDNYANIQEVQEATQKYLSIYVPQSLRNIGYECHFILKDNESVWALEFINNQCAWINITEKPILTNFYLNGVNFNLDGTIPVIGDETISESGLTEHAQGLERYNILLSGLNSNMTVKEILESVKYTQLYTKEFGNDSWLSEYCGTNGLNIGQDRQEFYDTYIKGQSSYKSRTRENPITDHTLHTSIYNEGKLNIYSQEKYSENDLYEFSIAKKIINHSELTNLDYENSGHIGFQKEIQDLDVIRTNANNGAIALQETISLNNNKVDKVVGKSLISDSEIERLANVTNYNDADIKTEISSLSDTVNKHDKDLVNLDNELVAVKQGLEEQEKALNNLDDIKANKTDIPDTNLFITKAVDDLVNYYKKTETYTQSEINQLISAIKTISMKLVPERPETGETNIIYLVPSAKQEPENIYDEYVYIDNKWERIGSTEISLSNYYTKEEITQLLSNYITSNDLEQMLTNYVKNTDVAQKAVYGLVKIDNFYGIGNTDEGKLRASVFGYDDYLKRQTNNFISKGTLENVVIGKELTNKTYVDGEIEKLDNRIDEIELFKFPNVIIHGNLTINNGQISNFSSENYLSLPAIFDLHDRGFEFNFAFRTENDVTTAQNILGSNFCIALFIQNSKLRLRVSSNGTSWDLVDIEGNIDITANTLYYIQIYFDKLTYKLKYSQDGITYTDIASKVASVSPFAKQIYLGIGNNFHNPFGGIINLNNCNLKVNKSVIWQGMDDAGLATRMATDMDNIDEAGKEKINEIVTEKGYIKDTDYATSTKGGVIKVSSNWTGIHVKNNGEIYLNTLTYDNYKSLPYPNYGITKGTLENVIVGKELINKTQMEEYINSLDKSEVDY